MANRRLLWACDEQAVLKDMAVLLQPWQGKSLLDRSSIIDAEQIIAKAVAARETFASVTSMWMRLGLPPMILQISGAPQYNAQGRFTGYRGFALRADAWAESNEESDTAPALSLIHI